MHHLFQKCSDRLSKSVMISTSQMLCVKHPDVFCLSTFELHVLQFHIIIQHIYCSVYLFHIVGQQNTKITY